MNEAKQTFKKKSEEEQTINEKHKRNKHQQITN